MARIRKSSTDRALQIVREFTLADVWDAIEIRGVLEGTAARMAAERITDAGELEALRRHNEHLEELVPLTAEDFSRFPSTRRGAM
jgi:GntR family transcriptional regulator, vanillate catabolism transcriptional regulator